MVVESLKLDLDISTLHNFVDFPVLFAANKFTVVIRKFDLKADLMMKGLVRSLGFDKIAKTIVRSQPLLYPVP